MIILDTTTKSLEFKLGGAVTTNHLPFTASYVDISQSDFSLTGVASSDGQDNAGTAVTMVAAPAASTSRQIKFLSIPNLDTVVAVVTIQLNDNGTKRVIWTGTLAVGDNLIYTEL